MWPGPTPSAKPVSRAPIRTRPRRWNAARGRPRRAAPRSWSRRTASRCWPGGSRPAPTPSSVRVGPLPHLQEVADAAARRPAYVVVLADRDGTDVIAHAAGDQVPARRFEVGDRPDAQHDPHPDRPPAQHHGVRHLTDREPESGGQRNAEFIAGRVAEAADSVAAHVVIGAGDEHILDAIAEPPARDDRAGDGHRGRPRGGRARRLTSARGSAPRSTRSPARPSQRSGTWWPRSPRGRIRPRSAASRPSPSN